MRKAPRRGKPGSTRLDLRDLDLSAIFAAPTLSPDLPPEIFARRATRRLPGAVVVPGHGNEPGLPEPGSVLGKYRLERTIGIIVEGYKLPNTPKPQAVFDSSYLPPAQERMLK